MCKEIGCATRVGTRIRYCTLFNTRTGNFHCPDPAEAESSSRIHLVHRVCCQKPSSISRSTSLTSDSGFAHCAKCPPLALALQFNDKAFPFTLCKPHMIPVRLLCLLVSTPFSLSCSLAYTLAKCQTTGSWSREAGRLVWSKLSNA